MTVTPQSLQRSCTHVRLIGGREETGASRLCRAARGASRLPDTIPLRRVMGHMLLPREQQLADGSYVTRIYKNQNDQRAKGIVTGSV